MLWDSSSVCTEAAKSKQKRPALLKQSRAPLSYAGALVFGQVLSLSRLVHRSEPHQQSPMSSHYPRIRWLIFAPMTVDFFAPIQRYEYFLGFLRVNLLKGFLGCFVFPHKDFPWNAKLWFCLGVYSHLIPCTGVVTKTPAPSSSSGLASQTTANLWRLRRVFKGRDYEKQKEDIFPNTFK